MTDGRVLHATLDLLDRQLLDRDGVLCGNVDDLEIQRDDTTGEMFVTALLTGPGILAYRLGARRLGRWTQRANRRLHDDDAPGALTDRTRIPIELAQQIGPSISVAVGADDLASHDAERWALAHIIDHIPGNASRAPQ
ncbi:MAG: hypothetical protein JWL72_2004 [Ilumatobacteraceae bacterium]|nr:hypothetical protein [Ilumatobacteraceae bacterium]